MILQVLPLRLNWGPSYCHQTSSICRSEVNLQDLRPSFFSPENLLPYDYSKQSHTALSPLNITQFCGITATTGSPFKHLGKEVSHVFCFTFSFWWAFFFPVRAVPHNWAQKTLYHGVFPWKLSGKLEEWEEFEKMGMQRSTAMSSHWK